MLSIENIKASDGTANASVATIQAIRSTGATAIIVDTVAGINPTGFAGSMGTPHTFIDPITSEEITVISDATAVDFIGHVDGSNLEIDTIAPGYTDAGSAVGDIVIIKPTTQYADTLAAILEIAHNDDGTLKDDAVSTDAVADDAITADKVAAGACVQMVSSLTGAVATGTTVIPYDDTIPQNTEGDQYLSLSITPKSATNKLVIEVLLFLSNSAGTVTGIGALFQDATANALAAGDGFQLTGSAQIPVLIKHEMAAGTTSATTFKVRAGFSGAGTTTLNGQSGNRRFGGVQESSIIIREYKA